MDEPREIQGAELGRVDVLQILQESAADGSYYPIPRLSDALIPSDLTDSQRRDAIAQAANEKLAESIRRGQFKDLEGMKEFLGKLGIDQIRFSEDILSTMRELSDKVGDAIFTNDLQVINGKVRMNGEWISVEDAVKLRDQQILRNAGFADDDLPEAVKNLRIYRGMLQALRAGPRNEFYSAFYENVMPIFSPEQSAELRQLSVPKT